MSEQRIVCIGTGKRLTNPSSIHPENGRYYRYPPPGTIHRWEGYATAFEQQELPGHKLVAAYVGGPEIQGYGILSLADTYAQELRALPESSESVAPVRREFETKIFTALERARPIAEDWSSYGAVIIAGELPTPEELERARNQRKHYFLNILNRAIDLHKAARGGLYTRAERAAAEEYGIVLPETVDSLPKVAIDEQRVACPECGEAILPQARVCIHCRTKFKMPVMEMLTAPAVDSQTAV